MLRSPLLPLHEEAGARLTAPDADGRRRLLTYGDVPAEYAAAEGGCLLLDLTEHGALAVGGSEAVAFLHRILAGDVRGLQSGQAARNLLLSGKGKVQADFELELGEDGLRATTAPGEAEALRAALDMYLFSEDVTLEDITEQTAPLALTGPRAAELAASVVGSAPAGPGQLTTGSLEGNPVRLVRLPVAGSDAIRLDAGPAHAPALWRALAGAGAQPAGVVVRDILRVEACRALWGADIDDGIYPQEARLGDGFSLDKGCYIGQEVVAKIDTYGGLNKCLFALRVDHDDPVRPGARLMREDSGEWRDLGVITSWAYSFVLDTGLVLGYVKRKHQALGATFRIDDGPATATIVELPVRAGSVAVSGPLPT